MSQTSLKIQVGGAFFTAILLASVVAISGCGRREKEPQIKPKKPIPKTVEKKAAPEVAPRVTGEKLEVSYVQGEVVMGQDAFGQKERSPLAPGQKIEPGTRIQSQPRSQSDLILPDDEIEIRIKENTDVVGGSFALLKNRRQGSLDLKRGTTYVEIKPEYRGTFSVTTPALEIRAVGTAFCVEVYGTLGDAWVGMSEGEAEVTNLLTGEETLLREGESLEFDAAAGRIEIAEMPEDEKEYLQREIRRIGSRLPEELEPKIELVLPKSKDRLETFLTATAIASNGKEPRRIHSLLMKALRLMEEGVAEEKKAAMLESVAKLESALLYYQDPLYAPDLTLFIAVYYRNLREYDKALAALDKVLSLYPDAPVASLAAAAKARIYEENLKDYEKAQAAYLEVLEKYGDSPEREEAMDGLDRVRTLKNE